MSNTIKQLKEWFKDQLDAPMTPEFLLYYVYEETVEEERGDGVRRSVEKYTANTIAPKDLKLLKDHELKSLSSYPVIPIFTLPKVQDDNSTEA